VQRNHKQVSNSRRRTPTLSDILSLLALIVAMFAAWISLDTKHQQYDERLSIGIEAYEPSFIHASVTCGAVATLIKPYRITLINTGNAPLTITRSMVDIGGDKPGAGLVHSQDIILLGEQGSQTALPLKLEAADSKVYYTLASYPLPPAVTTLLCSGAAMGQPLPDRDAIVRRLQEASVDLQGNTIHPQAAMQAGPAFLWAPDLSDFPPMSIQVETARGGKAADRIIDKAAP